MIIIKKKNNTNTNKNKTTENIWNIEMFFKPDLGPNTCAVKQNNH